MNTFLASNNFCIDNVSFTNLKNALASHAATPVGAAAAVAALDGLNTSRNGRKLVT
jgi:hypothetical protein